MELRLSVVAAEAAPGYAGTRDLLLHSGESLQIDRVLADLAPGVTRGILQVEKTAGSSPYLAYAVVNDNGTGDGSWIPAVADSELAIARGPLVIPAIVETGRYSSEVVVTNLSPLPRTVNASFTSEYATTSDQTVRFALTVPAGGQLDLQDFVQHLRDEGITGVPPRGPDIAAALFLTPSDGDSTTLLAAARTSTSTPAGRYGVYTPAIPRGASGGTYFVGSLFGLRQDSEVRSNLGLVNTGDTARHLHLSVAGDKGVFGPASDLHIEPGRWMQVNEILKEYAPRSSSGLVSIYADGPFLAYGVINDGSEPGKGTGDGSYIPTSSFSY